MAVSDNVIILPTRFDDFIATYFGRVLSGLSVDLKMWQKV
jgi:hypothetical protein